MGAALGLWQGNIWATESITPGLVLDIPSTNHTFSSPGPPVQAAWTLKLRLLCSYLAELGASQHSLGRRGLRTLVAWCLSQPGTDSSHDPAAA